MTKGFVTVATGDENYYRLAANLYKSYKLHGNCDAPFAIICDRENKYTDCFDTVIIVDNYRKSTLDKLLMIRSPYDETIFLDSDILIIDSVNELWDIFKDEDDVTAFGCILSLNSNKGWFTFNGSGKYKEKIKYLISMNGGIYYFRKTKLAEVVFKSTEDIIYTYNEIDFKIFLNTAR